MLAELHDHQLAHRRLSTHAFLVDGGGRPWLTDLRLGEVAAGTLQQRLDVAEMLTVLSICFGYERTVRAAVARLGEDDVAAALPMLQPVVLTRNTRSALKKSKGLLKNIREAVQALHPSVDPEPVKLERLSPKTLFSVCGLSFAVYLLLASNKDWSSLTAVNWWWTGFAALASAGTYVAAAMALDGFVPEKLRWARTILSQVAASFVTLVAPGGGRRRRGQHPVPAEDRDPHGRGGDRGRRPADRGADPARAADHDLRGDRRAPRGRGRTRPRRPGSRSSWRWRCCCWSSRRCRCCGTT